MSYKSIPLTRATTAWGLLKDVQRALLSEPKRANMNVFKDTQSPEQGGPACGTVGCFAGWVCLLAGAREHDDYMARAILGRELDYYIPNSGSEYVFNAGSGDRCAKTEPGTKAHARAVFNRIQKFMKVNEVALKARKLAAILQDVRA